MQVLLATEQVRSLSPPYSFPDSDLSLSLTASCFRSSWLSMLQRVGLAHRRQLERTASLTKTNFLLAHPSIFGQCFTSASAPAHRPILSRPAVTGFQPAGQQSSALAKTPLDPRDTKGDEDPVQLLTALFARTDDALKILRKAQSSPVILAALRDRKRIIRVVEAVASLSPSWARRVLVLAHSLGCSLKQNVYETAAHQMALSKHWNLLLSVVSLGEKHTGKSTTRLLNWRIRALMETQNYAPLRHILDQFTHHELKPNKRSFDLLISSFIRNRNLALTKEMLVKMRDAGVPPDADTHALIAMNYRSFGVNDDVQLHALKNLQHLTGSRATAMLNSLLQLRMDAQDIPGALELLAFFKQSMVSSILRALVGDGSIPRDGNWDAQETPASVIPSAATFSIFINYMATQKDLASALYIFNDMVATGVEPTAGTVTSLIHAHFSVGAVATAVRMVAEMCDQQKSPLAMFAPFMPVDEQWALPLLTFGMKPTSQIFNALLKGLLQTQGLNCILSVLHIMRANEVTPNTATLEVIISHLSKAEHVPPSTLFRTLRSLTSPSLRPALRHLHVIFSAIMRHERYLAFGKGWNATAAPLSYKRRATTKPRALLPNRLSGTTERLDPIAGIDLPHKPAYRALVRPILQSLSDRRVRSDGVMMGLRIKRDAELSEDLQSAKDLFQTLLVRGLQPNEYHFSALMEGFARSGNLNAAVGVLNSARQAGVKPNVVMFTILIVGYARLGKPEDSVRVFQEMVSANIKPDVPSIDAVASAFFAIGAYATARSSLITMWAYIEPFPEELRVVSLKDLARQFRLLHAGEKGPPRALSKQEKIQLYRKLSVLVKTWRSTTPTTGIIGRKKYGTPSFRRGKEK